MSEVEVKIILVYKPILTCMGSEDCLQKKIGMELFHNSSTLSFSILLQRSEGLFESDIYFLEIRKIWVEQRHVEFWKVIERLCFNYWWQDFVDSDPFCKAEENL